MKLSGSVHQAFLQSACRDRSRQTVGRNDRLRTNFGQELAESDMRSAPDTSTPFLPPKIALSAILSGKKRRNPSNFEARSQRVRAAFPLGYLTASGGTAILPRRAPRRGRVPRLDSVGKDWKVPRVR
jgi:hypothetical protein